MSIWFTSDQHFGHANIVRFCSRPFVDEWGAPDVPRMNRVLVDNWNFVVGQGDTVYILGDLCMGKKDESLPLITRLTGHKIFLPGNHDKCWIGDTAGAKLGEWRQRYLDAGIDEIIDTGAQYGEPLIEIAGQSVKMSHFPYVGDSFERGHDKFSPWRPDDDGGWLLHGHVHDSWKVQDRMINVGVDVWDYTPVHITQIAELIDK